MRARKAEGSITSAIDGSYLEYMEFAFGPKGNAMFSAEEIQARLREKPFRPLRLIAREGLRFDIDHPDLVLVGRRDLMIGTPDPATPSIYDRVIRVALVHVVALEDLPIAPPTSSNGPTT